MHFKERSQLLYASLEYIEEIERERGSIMLLELPVNDISDYCRDAYCHFKEILQYL